MDIPIIKIKSLLDQLIAFIVANEASIDIPPTEKWLHRVFDGQESDGFNFHTELTLLLVRANTDPRKLRTRLMFDPTKASTPTIHIHMSAEQPGDEDSIGMRSVSNDYYENTDGSLVPKLGRSFATNYDLIITSENNMEVIAIYEFLKAIFIAATDTLSNNFSTFKYSGRELMFNDRVMPPNVFFKAMTVKFDYEAVVPSLVSTSHKVEIEGDGGIYLSPDGGQIVVTEGDKIVETEGDLKVKTG